MIISRTGETLIVSTSGRKVNVVTDNTKTKDNKGLLGLRKEYMSNTVLIPGLRDRNRQAHSIKSVDWYKTAAEALYMDLPTTEAATINADLVAFFTGAAKAVA